MITPIKAMKISEICERSNDLLVSVDDIEELAKNERIKVIDEFAKRMLDVCANNGMSCDSKTGRPLYAHEDGTWHDLIEDISGQMKQ